MMLGVTFFPKMILYLRGASRAQQNVPSFRHLGPCLNIDLPGRVCTGGPAWATHQLWGRVNKPQILALYHSPSCTQGLWKLGKKGGRTYSSPSFPEPTLET
ncbi:hypothetical protein ACRRTK_012828 [Alexandromys fortis]